MDLSNYILPAWGSFCFAHIPAFIEERLENRFNRIFLFLIDAFGWRFLESHLNHQTILYQNAEISKLTSLFPSTTTGCISTLHTGKPPGVTGLYELYILEPSLNQIIRPVRFSFGGDRTPNTLLQSTLTPEELFPSETLYHRLAAKGIPSFAFQHESYALSPFSSTVLAGSQIVPYKNLDHGISLLQNSLPSTRTKGYWVFYYDAFDALSHKYGPKSPELLTEADKIFKAIDGFISALPKQSGKTLLLVTADHGHIETNPTMIYLDKSLPELTPLLQRGSDDEPLMPAGSPRDLFLHVFPEYLAEAYEMLTQHLQDRARVFYTEDLINQGIFGPMITERFRTRVGNLVVLPSREDSIWWSGGGKFERNYLGNHGGLTAEEMEVPFMVMVV